MSAKINFSLRFVTPISKEWALLSISKPGRVLEWFGSKKPSAATVEKSEKRIQYFKHR
jgi:hypothetical protein